MAKIMGVKQVIALASSKEKLDLVESLGADVAINYSERTWADRVRQATGGKGADIVLEAASGEVGAESFKLIAPFGRVIFSGPGISTTHSLRRKSSNWSIRTNRSLALIFQPCDWNRSLNVSRAT